MKKLCLIFILALLGALACAQQSQFSIGAVVEEKGEALKTQPGVDFGLTAYDTDPLIADEDSIIGFVDFATGVYPQVPRKTWLKPRVDVEGIKYLEGVDYDPTGNAPENGDRKYWLPLSRDPMGGWSIAIDTTNMLGPVSFRFRLRTRENRKEVKVLILKLVWRRGGDIFHNFRLTVQKDPPEYCALRGEDRLPYLRGFIPATAQPEGGTNNQQNVYVPPQTASTTAEPQHTQHEAPNPDRKESNSKKEKGVVCDVTVGAYQSDTNYKFCPGNLSREEKNMIAEAEGNTFEPNVSEIRLSRRWSQTVLVLISDKKFYVTARKKVQKSKKKIEAQLIDGCYKLVLYGTNAYLVDGLMVTITDDDGHTREIVFKYEEAMNYEENH